MQLHRQNKVRTSENSLLFIFPNQQNKSATFSTVPPKKKTKTEDSVAWQHKHNMEAACVSTSAVRPWVYVGYIQTEKQNKTKCKKGNQSGARLRTPQATNLFLVVEPLLVAVSACDW